MWPFRRRRTVGYTGPEDEQLWAAVRAIVDEETEQVRAEGRVSVDVRPGPLEEAVEGGIEIRPTAPEAAPLGLSVWSDTIGVQPGRSHGGFEIWTTEPEWETTLRDVIRCLREGRYGETVKFGRFFSFRVKMRFEGIFDGKGRTWTPTYASLPDPPRDVTAGEHAYDPW